MLQLCVDSKERNPFWFLRSSSPSTTWEFQAQVCIPAPQLWAVGSDPGECSSLEPGIPEAQGIISLLCLASSGFPSAAFPCDCLDSPNKFFSHLALSKSCKQFSIYREWNKLKAIDSQTFLGFLWHLEEGEVSLCLSEKTDPAAKAT